MKRFFVLLIVLAACLLSQSGKQQQLLISQKASSGGPTLSGSVTTSTSAINLTTEGTVAWAHWGGPAGGSTCAGYDHKSGDGNKISDYTQVQGGSTDYNNDARVVNWTDGTTTASNTNNGNGCFTNTSTTGDGYRFTCLADTTVRVCKAYVGGFQAASTRMTAHLSDSSASDYVDTSCSNGAGAFDCNYTFTYAAASSAQTLSVTWIMNGTGTNVTISAATLH